MSVISLSSEDEEDCIILSDEDKDVVEDNCKVFVAQELDSHADFFSVNEDGISEAKISPFNKVNNYVDTITNKSSINNSVNIPQIAKLNLHGPNKNNSSLDRFEHINSPEASFISVHQSNLDTVEKLNYSAELKPSSLNSDLRNNGLNQHLVNNEEKFKTVARLLAAALSSTDSVKNNNNLSNVDTTIFAVSLESFSLLEYEYLLNGRKNKTILVPNKKIKLPTVKNKWRWKSKKANKDQEKTERSSCSKGLNEHANKSSDKKTKLPRNKCIPVQRLKKYANDLKSTAGSNGIKYQNNTGSGSSKKQIRIGKKKYLSTAGCVVQHNHKKTCKRKTKKHQKRSSNKINTNIYTMSEIHTQSPESNHRDGNVNARSPCKLRLIQSKKIHLKSACGYRTLMEKLKTFCKLEQSLFGANVSNINNWTNFGLTDITELKSGFTLAYAKVFNEDTEVLCTNMGDLLLIVMKEARNCESRKLSAAYLTCKQLRGKEIKMATNCFNGTLKKYSRSFARHFGEMFLKILYANVGIDRYKALLLGLFLKLFLKVSTIAPELSDNINEAKEYVKSLLPPVLNTSALIRTVFWSETTDFERDCWIVLDFMQDLSEESSDEEKPKLTNIVPCQSVIADPPTTKQDINNSSSEKELNEVLSNTQIKAVTQETSKEQENELTSDSSKSEDLSGDITTVAKGSLSSNRETTNVPSQIYTDTMHQKIHEDLCEDNFIKKADNDNIFDIPTQFSLGETFLPEPMQLITTSPVTGKLVLHNTLGKINNAISVIMTSNKRKNEDKKSDLMEHRSNMESNGHIDSCIATSAPTVATSNTKKTNITELPISDSLLAGPKRSFKNSSDQHRHLHLSNSINMSKNEQPLTIKSNESLSLLINSSPHNVSTLQSPEQHNSLVENGYLNGERQKNISSGKERCHLNASIYDSNVNRNAQTSPSSLNSKDTNDNHPSNSATCSSKFGLTMLGNNRVCVSHTNSNLPPTNVLITPSNSQTANSMTLVNDSSAITTYNTTNDDTVQLAENTTLKNAPQTITTPDYVQILPSLNSQEINNNLTSNSATCLTNSMLTIHGNERVRCVSQTNSNVLSTNLPIPTSNSQIGNSVIPPLQLAENYPTQFPNVLLANNSPTTPTYYTTNSPILNNLLQPTRTSDHHQPPSTSASCRHASIHPYKPQVSPISNTTRTKDGLNSLPEQYSLHRTAALITNKNTVPHHKQTMARGHQQPLRRPPKHESTYLYNGRPVKSTLQAIQYNYVTNKVRTPNHVISSHSHWTSQPPSYSNTTYMKPSLTMQCSDSRAQMIYNNPQLQSKEESLSSNFSSSSYSQTYNKQYTTPNNVLSSFDNNPPNKSVNDVPTNHEPLTINNFNITTILPPSLGAFPTINVPLNHSSVNPTPAGENILLETYNYITDDANPIQLPKYDKMKTFSSAYYS